jgi:hypothetical protein
MKPCSSLVRRAGVSEENIWKPLMLKMEVVCSFETLVPPARLHGVIIQNNGMWTFIAVKSEVLFT